MCVCVCVLEIQQLAHIAGPEKKILEHTRF